MASQFKAFVNDDKFLLEDRAFLLTSPDRGVNNSEWLHRRVPSLRIAAVRSRNDSLDELAISLGKTKHNLGVVSAKETIEYVKQHTIDVLVMHMDEIQEIKTEQLPNSVLKFVLPRSINDKKLPSGFIELHSPDYSVFLKTLARSLDVAPVYILSGLKGHAARFASYLDSMSTYFSSQFMDFRKFVKYASDDQLTNLSNAVLIYLDKPGEEYNVGQNINLSKLLAQNGTCEFPVIYVNPKKFWRNHHLHDLMNSGLFDFVGSNISKYFTKDSAPENDAERRELMIAFEQVVNAVHSAFLGRDVFPWSHKEAYNQSRKRFPHIFFHASRDRSIRYMSDLLVTMGARTYHPHIGKQFNDIDQDAAIEESILIANALNPNMFYFELGPGNETGNIKGLNAFLKFHVRFPNALFVLSYNPNEIAYESISSIATEGVTLIKNPRDSGQVPAQCMKMIWQSFQRRFQHSHGQILSTNSPNNFHSLLAAEPRSLEALLSTSFGFSEDNEPQIQYLGEGVYPGAASGRLYTDLQDAIAAKRLGKQVIFYVKDLSILNLSDIKEMRRFDGLMFTSLSEENHNTIDLQRSGVPIIRIGNFFEDSQECVYEFGDFIFQTDNNLSFDGATGHVYTGSYKVKPSAINPKALSISSNRAVDQHYMAHMSEVDKILNHMKLEVMVNADTVTSMRKAREWGVDSVGLVRSENILKQHNKNLMAYGKYVMLLLSNKTEGVEADNVREELKNAQIDSFYEILKYQDGRLTQIRLLDAPLHELFAQKDVFPIREEFSGRGYHTKEFFEMVESQRSIRGAQILKTWPSVYEIQLHSLFSAAKRAIDEGHETNLRVFIPYVDEIEQVREVKEMAEQINKEEFQGAVRYELGVTLETPNGCSSAGVMIRELNIKNFALGTNDLFPLLDGTADRYVAGISYKKSSRDGTPLLSDGIITTLNHTLDKMDEAAREGSIEYNIGLCGELNEIKLHPENLGSLLHRFDYFSAGRSQQIPILKLMLAQALIKSASATYGMTAT
jgi:hypothetical protein